MANLTKEYFDTKLDKLGKGFDTKLDKLINVFDIKLDKLEASLKQHTEQEVGNLAAMVARGFEELEKKLDVRFV